MAFATDTDVTALWGRDASPEEIVLINLRLAQVERMIIRRIPDLVAQVTAATISIEDVVQVEADAVLRLVRNPDGYLSETDGNYTYMLQAGSTPGALFLTPDDWAALGIVARRMSILIPDLPMPQ